ncbi:MAG: sodium:proton antiporter [Flammeovirgaceae bacterium]
MKRFILLTISILGLVAFVMPEALAFGVNGINEVASGGGDHTPSTWSVIPFAILLTMIATGPLFYEHFWHSNYPKIAVILAAIVVSYYLFGLHNYHGPVHAFFEYFQFIALLSSLYIASGGVLIKIDKEGKPLTNVIILIIGAVISNVIGTTGASMLLIRPFIRLNKERIHAYHVVFFIFMVSNVGGCLTPIGDPPLFLGFLKGVPFGWTLTHSFTAWVFAIVLLSIIFYIVDSRNKTINYLFVEEDAPEKTGKISLEGKRSFIWLGIIIIAVFLDPNVEGFEWVPAIPYDGQKFSFIREIIMLSVAYLSYKYANQNAMKGNEFNFEPIREVAFIFIGIFGTMMPALELVANFAASPEGKVLISHNTLYWGTGIISGFLDNAPTYLNFLTAALAAQDGSISNTQDVINFAYGNGFEDSVVQLLAISVSAVFFGAMTYIGNGPNFMVKSIAEQIGIRMPSFFGYILRFSIPILLPALLLVWLVFFAFL